MERYRAHRYDRALPAKETQFDSRDLFATARYADFFTSAVRPDDEYFEVQEGFGYREAGARNGPSFPFLIAAVSRDKLWDVFQSLLPVLGSELHVCIESSHRRPRSRRPLELWRTWIETNVLQSHLIEHERLILDDGCTGVAATKPNRPDCEVHLDEHKVIRIYDDHDDFSVYRDLLRSNGVEQRKRLQVVSDVDHVHCTSAEFSRHLRELTRLIDVDERV